MQMTASSDTSPPLILIWTDDLFILPRLEDGLQAAGYRTRFVDQASDLGAQGASAERRIHLTEPIEGPDAGMLESITELHPVLILVDTTCSTVPWAHWIQILKTSSATRRIPILAFGPHVSEQLLEQARRMGADHVVTRGRLHASLVDLAQKWARVVPKQGIESACEGRLSAKALAGLRQLNAGEYYQAHEDLEQAWMDALEHEGYLYRALLQIAVAYLQIERGNHAGATKMLLRMRQWLDPLPETCRGVDLAQVKADIERLRISLAAANPERLADLDQDLLVPIPFSDPEGS
jgi:CheY-like chemotaxis protein